MGDVEVHATRLVPVADLRPHPENYREHPDDQRAHIAQSFREVGVYRNVVAARDLTILAGHGVVTTAVEEGVSEVPVVVLDLDPTDPRALKIVAGDNEIARLAVVDDRALAELLRRVASEDPAGLLGTGFDDATLATLVMVTLEATAPEEFPSIDPTSMQLAHTCPRCGFEWTGSG